METERYNEYNAFAWVYNKHWGSISVSMMPILERILLSKLPANAKILDLCCGIGTVVGELLKRSYDVVGLDGSEEAILNGLDSVGFQSIKTIDAHNEFEFGPQGRPFFYGQKASS